MQDTLKYPEQEQGQPQEQAVAHAAQAAFPEEPAAAAAAQELQTEAAAQNAQADAVQQTQAAPAQSAPLFDGIVPLPEAAAAPGAAAAVASAPLKAADVSVMPAPPNPFLADKIDCLFALLFSCVGYFYVYALIELMSALFLRRAWPPTLPMLPMLVFPLFVCVYAAAVLAYLYAKKRKPSRESWLWLGVLFCLSLPMPFYSAAPLYQLWAIHLVALYWTLCAGSRLLCGGKTGAGLPFDALNAGLIVPWGNFFSHIRVLLYALRGTKVIRRAGPVLLGLALALPLLLFVVPLLSQADSGFAMLVDDILWRLTGDIDIVWVRFILSLPVTCILFGAAYGAVHGRNAGCFEPTQLHRARTQLRIVPSAAVTTVFCAVGVLYALFLALQSSYIFGALAGRLPEAFSYSRYAREGFFELCRIGGINLCVLAVANLFCRTPRRENVVLRVCNMVLCGLSLLLTATAAAKLGLYIAAYGLTVNRVLPAVFLLWMALAFAAVLVWQLRSFSVVRFAVLTGAVLVALTCAVNVTNLCVVYNDTRVAAGTLEAAPDYEDSYDTWGLGSYGIPDRSR